VEDPKALVASGYDRMFRRYATWSSGDVLRHRYIDLVIEQNLIKPGASALDLGCGTGALATKYLSERFDVTGVDISQRSIDAARRDLPGARFVVADMATIDFPPRTFELVTAFYSLIHVPRQEHASVLGRIATWLRPGGVLIATMSAKDGGEGAEPDWLGVPMYWSNWNAETNCRLVTQAGFEIVRAVTEETFEDGEPVPFLWIVASNRPAE
jgi:ubiquinone/menaquinone biosynthesis C-methylase UbiE